MSKALLWSFSGRGRAKMKSHHCSSICYNSACHGCTWNHPYPLPTNSWYAQVAERFSTTITPIKTRVWRASNSPTSVFILMDEKSIIPRKFLEADRLSFPFGIGYGITTSRENCKIIAEVTLFSDEYVDRAVTKAISVGEHRLFGSRPLALTVIKSPCPPSPCWLQIWNRPNKT